MLTPNIVMRTYAVVDCGAFSIRVAGEDSRFVELKASWGGIHRGSDRSEGECLSHGCIVSWEGLEIPDILEVLACSGGDVDVGAYLSYDFRFIEVASAPISSSIRIGRVGLKTCTTLAIVMQNIYLRRR